MDAYITHRRGDMLGNTWYKAAILDLPRGNYIITATADLECPEVPVYDGGVGCTLRGGAVKQEIERYFTSASFIPQNPVHVTLSIGAYVLDEALSKEETEHLGPATLVFLASSPGQVRVFNITMTAIAVDNVLTQ